MELISVGNRREYPKRIHYWFVVAFCLLLKFKIINCDTCITIMVRRTHYERLLKSLIGIGKLKEHENMKHFVDSLMFVTRLNSCSLSLRWVSTELVCAEL